jgi:alkanesulfonate monooxygenase SsuD/methylene tetrahydromethanopterin reductase-like flavin-dependent oxidoreductase (luciferase family)
MKLGIALGWHSLCWEELLELTQLAEARGFAVVYHDGDVTMLGSDSQRDVLHGFTVSNALIARTQRIEVTSIRLVQHWNAPHLAQAIATAERIAPGRLGVFASIGERPEDPAFGIPRLSTGQRIQLLDEAADAIRALLRGEEVTRDGTFVKLAGARVRPVPPHPIRLELAGRRPRLLRVIARHADIWNLNWPPIPARVSQAEAYLRAACDEIGRDPDSLERRMWIFTRVRDPNPDVDRAEFRRLNPWFAELGDAEVDAASIVGKPQACWERLLEVASSMHIDLPVIDLSGSDYASVRSAIDALPAW